MVLLAVQLTLDKVIYLICKKKWTYQMTANTENSLIEEQ